MTHGGDGSGAVDHGENHPTEDVPQIVHLVGHHQFGDDADRVGGLPGGQLGGVHWHPTINEPRNMAFTHQGQHIVSR